MKKMQKVLAVVLAAALLLSVSVMLAFAAEPEITDVAIKTAPNRTVYYEGADTYQGNNMVCEMEGLVFTVSYDDGTSEDVVATYDNTYFSLPNGKYVLGENTPVVHFYGDSRDSYIDVRPTFTITVKENPVASIEVIKMPTKTVYDIDKDVITEENFSFERLREVAPEEFEAILDLYGMTYEEFVANVSEEEIKDGLFDKNEELLMIDTTGMEIRVTFKDGTSVDVTDEYDAIEYEGHAFGIRLEQESNEVTEGENTFAVVFMGKYAEFNVNVKKAAAGGGNVMPDKPAEKDDVKNPDIPKTGVAASLSAAAALMLAGTAGSALLVRRRDDA